MSAAHLDLAPKTWGGKRDGAGRKKSKTKHDAPHRSRDKHVGRHPVHVVLRTLPDVPRLRSDDVYEALAKTLAKVGERIDFRVVHVSLQHNHVHLLVEADNNDALESGMRAFAISFARRINRVFKRSGRVWAFRYHTTALTSPRQTRNALVYVINNWRRHNEDERELDLRTAKLDRFSSAIRFTEWHDWSLTSWPQDYVALPVHGHRTTSHFRLPELVRRDTRRRYFDSFITWLIVRPLGSTFRRSAAATSTLPAACAIPVASPTHARPASSAAFASSGVLYWQTITSTPPTVPLWQSLPNATVAAVSGVGVSPAFFHAATTLSRDSSPAFAPRPVPSSLLQAAAATRLKITITSARITITTGACASCA